MKYQKDKLVDKLLEFEKQRSIYWESQDPFTDLRLNWRASMMRHLFHILPGQKILEIGSGDGKFTGALVAATRGECKITAVEFSPEYSVENKKRLSENRVNIVCLESFPGKLKGEKFDYVVINHLLGHELHSLLLYEIKSLIKPGGGLLIFEPNPWNPYLQLRNLIQQSLFFFNKRKVKRCLLDRLQYFSILSEIGYIQINALPHDFLYSPIPRFLLWPAKNLSIIMENFPYLRNFAGSLCIWARMPEYDGQKEHIVDLCEHSCFFGKVSFVIPCHNEEMNIPILIKRLNDFYGKYILEIIIVDDNSTDSTVEVAKKLSEQYKNIHIIRRSLPNGVGRALRDGFQIAKGEYIFSMDSDFQHIIPEMRDLFDAIAAGADVAVGSRFSRKSVLVNYAFTKIVANRAFHLLANLLLGKRFRDISNNLKIFRKEVLENFEIESNDFAANAEIGLKPLLLGYKVEEVPISWINRSINMGFSTFQIIKTGPNYWVVLFRLTLNRIFAKNCKIRKNHNYAN